MKSLNTKSSSETSESCQPSRCDKCETKDQSPLCSVDGASQEIESARSAVRFKAGQTIFYQGNEPIGLYVIQSGLVKLESVSPEGYSNTLRLLGPGQALGYRALFSNEKYQASAVTVEEGTFCFVPKATLLSVVKQFPNVGLNLLSQLAKDLRMAEDKWVTQVNKGAPERVAEALLFLDENFQDQPWTRREIAQWAGTTPETVMRNLAQLEKDGIIEASGRVYKIINREILIKKSAGT